MTEAERFAEIIANGGTLPPMDEGDAPAITKPKARPKGDRKAKRASADRFGVLNEFYDVSLRTVSSVAGNVWFGLWRETRPPHGTATVSRQTLADRLGVHVSTVKRAIKELEIGKLITVVRRGNNSVGASTYRVHSTRKGSK